MLKFGNDILKVGTSWIDTDDYNPLNLPPYTIRFRYTTGQRPMTTKGTLTQVSSDPNIWDLTYENTNWSHLLYNYYMTDSSQYLLEILGVNSTGVTNMQGLFDFCEQLQSVPLFDTSNVTNMSHMFSCCCSIISIPLFDTSNVTNMSHMFNQCYIITSVPLFDTSNVTNMGGMFANCCALTSVPLFDTSNVTNMSHMFVKCDSIISIPLFNTSNVTIMTSMLEQCNSLKTIPLLNTSSVIDTYCMCYASLNVESGALALYQQLSTQTTPPSIYSNTFYRCGSDTVTGAAELAQIPTSWGGTLE